MVTKSMKNPDEDPHPSQQPSTEPFLFDGSGLSLLLVHGFGGTPYEMRYLGERVNAAGARVLGVRLAGHASTAEDLGASTYDNWYESVIDGLEQLRGYGDPIVVAGLSMGALLCARLTLDQREAIAGLVLIAPAFFIGFPQRLALSLIEPFEGFTDNIYLQQRGGSDIHDNAARSVHPRHNLMSLRAALHLHQLARLVRARLGEIIQPTLLIHSRLDHTCPYDKNTGYVMSHLGSAEKRAVILEESYHVITVDSEKDRVAEEVTSFALQFRRAAPRRRAAN
ncbi:MAG TPA: alpha/beta fold hydrolase [Candidatus Binataceae bacterium]|nr:alpha/beta fold hydrolase [Candidatus Binataceae bacterium]